MKIDNNDNEKEFNKEFNAWNNVKGIQTHLDILGKEYPGLIREIKSEPDLFVKDEVFKLNTNDSRVYIFKDSNGVDRYHRLMINGGRGTIVTVDSTNQRIFSKEELSHAVNEYHDGYENPSIQAVKAITEFTEQMVDPSLALC